jgi:hypothetical protein
MLRNKTAILALAGSIVFGSSSASEATHLDQVNQWITVGSAGKNWTQCAFPQTFISGNSATPYFKINGSLRYQGSCWEIGPFSTTTKFGGPTPTDWWVQVISNLVTCANASPSSCAIQDLIRLCSTAFVAPRPLPIDWQPPPGPCSTKGGVGPGGCEVCAIAAP